MVSLSQKKLSVPLRKKRIEDMSTQALTGLRDYLTGTLSIADMNWLAGELNEYAHKGDDLSHIL